MASLYACGITPYDATHIGHANTYLAFDLLNRAWRAEGKQVNYTQNITDVDDPLLERATATGVDWRQLAASQMALFAGDMAALNVISPQSWVPVTEAMPDIIAAVTALLASGAAYFVDDNGAAAANANGGGDIYFDISSDAAFGSLAKLSDAEMLQLFEQRGGDPQRPGKRNALDPLLWRAKRPGEPWWDGGSLGPGRPGWHIGCTVIARETLGNHFDVLGGGSDLLFPHHEMSESIFRVLALLESSAHADKNAHAVKNDNKPVGARNFMYCGMISYQGEKMSKSLGNLVIVSDLLAQGVDPMAIRLALLAHHYRSDWEWTDAELEQGQVRLGVWRQRFKTAPQSDVVADAAAQAIAGMRAALADDLDAPNALAIVDEYLATEQQPAAAVRDAIDALLGVKL